MLDLIEPDHEAEAQAHTATVYGLEREAETRRNVGRFIRAMWVAVFMLLLFNSERLVTVVNGFGVGPVQDTAVALATTWNAQMEKNGLNRPVEIVRLWMIGLRDMTWDEVSAARKRDGTAGSLRGPLDNAPG
ncbi:MAG: hypothetical protein K8R18_05900 [Parvibaculum sp.]|uniref:hypothetical protein n=1 Tax=Parvibaculum sp. TaxID=2024848 RepID=UPI0025F298F8|nr:hypothetical protein [Parvibaculum sp.]MCE9649146.1 hypothetical protein [Parvibaculum sp.]